MKNQKGITLIVLVVTVIVLLILASTALTALLDDEGISDQAVSVSKKTEKDTWQSNKEIEDMTKELNSILSPSVSPKIEVVQDGETVWNNGTATIKLKVVKGGYPVEDNDEYTIKYKNGETWETYSAPITGLTHNSTIYVALNDETTTTNATITILDKKVPQEATIILGKNVENGYVDSATVTHTDNESGIKISSCKWSFNQISTLMGTNPNDYTNYFTSNAQKIALSKGDSTSTKRWYLHVLSVDVAENKIETIIGPVNVK